MKRATGSCIKWPPVLCDPISNFPLEGYITQVWLYVLIWIFIFSFLFDNNVIIQLTLDLSYLYIICILLINNCIMAYWYYEEGHRGRGHHGCDRMVVGFTDRHDITEILLKVALNTITILNIILVPGMLSLQW
jgi:hypothetical protein